jgi:hypothetical protein
VLHTFLGRKGFQEATSFARFKANAAHELGDQMGKMTALRAPKDLLNAPLEELRPTAIAPTFSAAKLCS